MPRSRLPKRASNADHKWFVSKDTDTSQETEYFLNQFFHGESISILSLFHTGFVTITDFYLTGSSGFIFHIASAFILSEISSYVSPV